MDDTDREYEQKYTFQLGEASRLPETKREKAAVERWMEVDRRRLEARTDPRLPPFHYTDAERQLKRRLIKAGLIIAKKQPKSTRRRHDAIVRRLMIDSAKRYAAAGDPSAIKHLVNHKEKQKRTAWLKRQRMLRRLEPRELMDALRDVMEKQGKKRRLEALWSEFLEGFEQASPERRNAFIEQESERLASMPAILEHEIRWSIITKREL